MTLGLPSRGRWRVAPDEVVFRGERADGDIGPYLIYIHVWGENGQNEQMSGSPNERMSKLLQKRLAVGREVWYDTSNSMPGMGEVVYTL